MKTDPITLYVENRDTAERQLKFQLALKDAYIEFLEDTIERLRDKMEVSEWTEMN